MANLDFYATGEDLRNLFHFLYAETDVTVYELSSEFDATARKFTSLISLEECYPLDDGRRKLFQLWSPSVMVSPVISKIALTVPGHNFRYAVDGAGLMQLYPGKAQDGVIEHTHFGNWNEAGAKARSIHPAEDCDWEALRKLSGKIQRFIRSKLSVGKLYSRPILSGAMARVDSGDGLAFGNQLHRVGSTSIVREA